MMVYMMLLSLLIMVRSTAFIPTFTRRKTAGSIKQNTIVTLHTPIERIDIRTTNEGGKVITHLPAIGLIRVVRWRKDQL